MKSIVVSMLLIALGHASAITAEHAPLPGGWLMEARPSANHYRIGLDRETRHGGKSSALLESQLAEFKKNHYARIVQRIDATSYRRMRLRLSAFIKTQDVQESARLWAVVGHPDSEYANDFRQKEPIQGTTDWKRYDVELTVVYHATQIECEVTLIGPGRIWVDDVTLEVIGNADDTSPTAPANARLPEPPTALFHELANTDFEQTQLEHDLSLMQGLWEIQVPAVEGRRVVTRHTKQVQGNKITMTDYFPGGEIWQQYTHDFDLERSGRMSLITLRSFDITAGMAKGSSAPAGFSSSHLYTINRSQFVEIFGIVDDNKGPPTLQQWNRVEGK